MGSLCGAMSIRMAVAWACEADGSAVVVEVRAAGLLESLGRRV